MQSGQTTPAGAQPQAAAAKERPRQKGPTAPPEFQVGDVNTLPEPELIKLLKNPASTTFQKSKACQRLASIGTEASVPAVTPLLTDPQLSMYARYALEPMPGTAADQALRAALPKLKGALLVGVINSIGFRKDAASVPAVSKLLYEAEAATAQASAAALGQISGAEAAKTLQTALGRTKGAVRDAVADACLSCAEGLLAKGEREPAMALYTAVSAPDVPKPARLAAMHGIIAAEISLKRPR